VVIIIDVVREVFWSVALLQVLALIDATIRARLRAH
jgi:hypothetical protein